MQVQSLMRIVRGTPAFLVGAAALLSAACLHPTGCDADLAVSFSPTDTTIAIGQSFRPRVRLATCGESKALSDTLRYSVDDSMIVRVDSVSGIMTGRAIGQTTATVTGAIYHVVARIAITVR